MLFFSFAERDGVLVVESMTVEVGEEDALVEVCVTISGVPNTVTVETPFSVDLTVADDTAGK